MGNNSMNPKAPGQTNPGGECMDYQEITLGQVTYEIRRVYSGDRPVSELVLDRMTQSTKPVPPFDEGVSHEVYSDPH